MISRCVSEISCISSFLHPHRASPIKGEGTARLHYEFPSLGGRGEGRGNCPHIVKKLAKHYINRLLKNTCSAVSQWVKAQVMGGGSPYGDITAGKKKGLFS
jgi:hypothetical protein